MHVILLKDIAGVGRKYDVRNVADGYARNYLIPKGLVRIATPQEISRLQQERKQLEELRQRRDEELKKLRSSLEGFVLEVRDKTDTKGKLYGSISARTLQDALAEKGLHLESQRIKLTDPIREVGERIVAVDLGVAGQVELRVKVMPE